jgi:hypothetical protein
MASTRRTKKGALILEKITRLERLRKDSLLDLEEVNHRIYNDLPIYDDEVEDEE